MSFSEYRGDQTDLAATCFSCHAPDGATTNIPSLSDKSFDYLYNRMMDFKMKKANSTIMYQHASGYSDSQIKDIINFYINYEK